MVVDNINKKEYKKRGLYLDVWKRLKKNRMAIIGMIILLAILILAITAEFIVNYEKDVIKQNIPRMLERPSKEHIFGTDEFGRDIFARVLYGARVSIMVGIVSVAIALSIGGTLGSIAGYYGGRLDNIIMRIMDIFLAIPSIMLAVTIVAALGANMFNLMLSIGISSVPQYARIVRAAVMSVKNQEFIEASRAIGAKNRIIIIREVIPNCMAPIIVQVTLNVADAIISTAALSFIGLGIQPPKPEWGSMLSGGRPYLRDAWHITFFPGLAIILTILSLNLLGDGLRDALDPKLK